ncbi:hypothetical protein [Candidatus Pristimantibacillus sp. PTI5]|uniref:hypothetical protein n=1 Tax=Candidatus Pristimantibacillus sp. PTI5 TaxID=3400422 RepID=UPI003B01A5AC
MRKKKLKKILIWSLSVVVILGIGGLFAANYAVDKFISTLAADLESNLVVDDTSANPNNNSSIEDNNSSESNAEENKELTSNSNSGAEQTEQETDKVNQSDNKNESRVSADNKQSVKSNESYSAEVSVDKAKEVQEKITVSEKAKVSTVLLEELSLSDIKQIQELASGGLDLEEKKQARSIILEKLSPEQYDELIQVAKKYGMSQGKSYDEVIKEK